MSYRRTNDASPLEVESSTAGASGGGDLEMGTCDWGSCDEVSVTMRWEDRLKRWLPVCAGHAPDREARCAALPPDHESWECE